jgi:hypothetical protein
LYDQWEGLHKIVPCHPHGCFIDTVVLLNPTRNI